MTSSARDAALIAAFLIFCVLSYVAMGLIV